MKKIILFTFLPLLSACSLFSPIKATNNKDYSLDPKPRIASATHTSNQTLLVSTTKTSPILTSKQMIYLRQPHNIEYFSTHRWAAPPAQMLAQSIATALQNSHHFRAVESAPFTGVTDLRLDTHLLVLQQEFYTQPSRIRMQLEASLVNTQTSTIIASRRFDLAVVAPQDNPYGGVMAANAAAAIIMQELVAFIGKYR
ncbi:hypothetical protein BH10PSE19_BH10PSE19_03180 [soil metagenome]